MNGAANCILELCCPPNPSGEASENSVRKLSEALLKDGVCSAEYAPQVARWTLKHFDLAERGTLQAFKASVVRILPLGDA